MSSDLRGAVTFATQNKHTRKKKVSGISDGRHLWSHEKLKNPTFLLRRSLFSMPKYAVKRLNVPSARLASRSRLR